MRKTLLFMALLVVIIFYYSKSEEYIVIPDDAIRFRIIPNSNSKEDLEIKEKVKNRINNEMNLVSNKGNVSEARSDIKSKIPLLEESINTEFKESNYNKSFKVKYGENYFPEKTYKGIKYKSGYYESLVVEIGKAKGDNFWCVLYPPLCMIDETKVEDKDYKFFIKDFIEKYL